MRYNKISVLSHVKRGMITFHVSKEIHASLDEIWNLVSDIDREPEFWHGTKSVKNIRKEGNIVERETVIAFRNAVCKEIVTLDAKNSVKKKILNGRITGTKDIKITPLAANLESMFNGASLWGVSLDYLEVG